MIEIIDYAPRWADEFCIVAEHLRRSLGGLAVRIDHIGSTSVPGLAAKDIIDSQVTVASLASAKRIVAAFEAAEYVHRPIPPQISGDRRPPFATGSDEHWKKLLFREWPGQRRANIQVRELGRMNQRYALLCRDFLRSNPIATAGYAELRRRIACHHGDSADAYLEIKEPAFDLIMAAAEPWAAATGWDPGPTNA
ncbi:MAG TPA: GrpB family protein [Candidatus Binataceae bacterium]|nr:GrpB family protein [Candidatus Binataceae bacterium]